MTVSDQFPPNLIETNLKSGVVIHQALRNNP